MSTYHGPVQGRHGVGVAPTTQAGRRAVQWAVASVVGMGASTLGAILADTSAPPGAPSDPKGLLLVITLVGTAVGLVSAVVAAILGVLAKRRSSERAVAVYLAFVPLLAILLSPLHALFMND